MAAQKEAPVSFVRHKLHTTGVLILWVVKVVMLI